MTSKEFIQNEIDNLEDILENAKKDNCNIIVKECEKDIKHYNQVLKDLEKLEHIKVLAEKYNNDEIHFTRGFDFINIVKEVLENDR